jgi:hypothetical protein
MSIKSYLAWAVPGKEQELLAAIDRQSACELIPSDQGRLFILLTETESEAADKELMAELQSIPSLMCLALTSAWAGEALNEQKVLSDQGGA